MADTGVNNFKAFATDPSAAVLSQALWDGVTLRPQGHIPGTPANAALENKALRQATTMVAAFGQLVANTGQDALDNGNVNQLAGKLSAMINVFGGGASASGIYRDSGFVVAQITSGSTFTIAQPVSTVSTLFKINDWIMINEKEMVINGISGDTTFTTISVTNGDLSIVDEGAMIQISFLELNGVEKIINKNVAGGYAPLDDEILVPRENLPLATEILLGMMRFATKQEAIDGAKVPAAMNPFYVKEYGSAVALTTMKELILTNWVYSNIRRSNTTPPSTIEWSEYLGMFVLVFPDGANTESIWTSPDGDVWTPRTHPGTNLKWCDIKWSSTIKAFVIIGNTHSSSCILSSFDGINWFSRVNPATYSGQNPVGLQAIRVKSNGSFVIMSIFMASQPTSASRVKSDDGINFTATPCIGLPGSSSNQSMSGFEYAPEIEVFIASFSSYNAGSKIIYKSNDCVNWSPATNVPPPPSGMYSSAGCPIWSPKFKFFAIMATYNPGEVNPIMILTSLDGDTWVFKTAPMGGSFYCGASCWIEGLDAMMLMIQSSANTVVGAWICDNENQLFWLLLSNTLPNTGTASKGFAYAAVWSNKLGKAVGVGSVAQTISPFTTQIVSPGICKTFAIKQQA